MFGEKRFFLKEEKNDSPNHVPQGERNNFSRRKRLSGSREQLPLGR
jgi:hypothetical protein